MSANAGRCPPSEPYAGGAPGGGAGAEEELAPGGALGVAVGWENLTKLGAFGTGGPKRTWSPGGAIGGRRIAASLAGPPTPPSP